MKLQRFFIDPTAISGKEIILSDKGMINQMKNVLRFRAGDKAVFLDGTGKEYTAVIKEIGNLEITGEISEVSENKNESELKIILCQALCKKDKFEWILQKGTEIGISEFIPVISERTEKLSFDRARTEKILKEAAEQSERGIIPKLRDTQKFEVYRGSTSIILDKSGESIKTYALRPTAYALNVFVGPEGGWTDQELQAAKERGARIVSLGPRVLRTETAGVVAAAVLLLK